MLLNVVVSRCSLGVAPYDQFSAHFLSQLWHINQLMLTYYWFEIRTLDLGLVISFCRFVILHATPAVRQLEQGVVLSQRTFVIFSLERKLHGYQSYLANTTIVTLHSKLCQIDAIAWIVIYTYCSRQRSAEGRLSIFRISHLEVTRISRYGISDFLNRI